MLRRGNIGMGSRIRSIRLCELSRRSTLATFSYGRFGGF